MKDEKQKLVKEMFNVINLSLKLLPGGEIACPECYESLSLQEVGLQEDCENEEHPFPFIQACGLDYFVVPISKRMVEVWNALAGIPDPQEFVEAAKELLEKMELLLGEASWRMDYEHNQDVIDDSKNAIIRFEKALGKV